MIEWLVKILGWASVAMGFIAAGMLIKEDNISAAILNMVVSLLWMIALLL